MTGYLTAVGAITGRPWTYSGIGINFSGSGIPGRTSVYGTDYIFPTRTQIAYWQGKGVTCIRLPFRWERLQRSLNSPLDTFELGLILQTASYAQSLGMGIILAPFQQNGGGGYDSVKIGTGGVPSSALADMWSRIATALKNNAGVIGYDILNEPNSAANGNVAAGTWQAIAQDSVTAIRAVDTVPLVFIEGLGFSSANGWVTNNNTLSVTDSANKLLYSAHCWFDRNETGQYPESYAVDGATSTRGADEIKIFSDWCVANGVRGHIGELGWPPNDANWDAVGAAALVYAAAHSLPCMYWAAGGINGSSAEVLCEPVAGVDATQTTAFLAKRSSLPRLVA